MNKDNLAEIFVNEFTEFKPLLEEHIGNYDELLPHIFFGECNEYFIGLLEEKETKKLKKLFDFFERMSTESDDYVKELLSVTILERLGDDKKILNTAYEYMGKKQERLQMKLKNFWGDIELTGAIVQ